MKISELKQLEQAPGSGTILGYLSKEVVFEPYSSLDDVRNRFGEESILELHLFDNEKEYRALPSRSARYAEKNGIIEYISDFSNQKDTVFKETVRLERGGKMNVLNHISYDDSNGMATIDDARLVMKEDE